MKKLDLTPGMVVATPDGGLMRIVSTDPWRRLHKGEKATRIAVGIETYLVDGIPDPRGKSVAVQRVVVHRGVAYPEERDAFLETPERLNSLVNVEFQEYVRQSNGRIRAIERMDLKRETLRALWGDHLDAAVTALGVRPEQAGMAYSSPSLLALGKVHYVAMQSEKR